LGGGAIDGPVVDGTDDVGEMDLAEVGFDLGHGRKREGFRHVETDVGGLEALFLDPLFDDGFVAYDAHPGLKGFEGHARVSCGVEPGEFRLVIVEVGRAEDGPAEAALGDEGVGAFRGDRWASFPFGRRCRNVCASTCWMASCSESQVESSRLHSQRACAT
jgi:hypothetical protein